MGALSSGRGLRLQIPHFAVSRHRLQRRLDSVRPGGVGLIAASAGWGKSVLLSQWAEGRPELAVPSVALTASDNDAVVFARRLVSAIGAVVPEFDAGVGGLVATGGAALGDVLVEGLLRELEGLPRELVVMLDDAHVLTNSALSRDVGLLVAHLPENVRFMIGARWDPPLPLRQLRMEGRLVQIRATDLAFDVDEAQQLVATVAERDVSGEQIATLVRRTDGWAVALQLAAISLQRAPDVGAFVEAFAGNDRLVVEYLTEEVLDRQDPATRRILLRTSVLGWLSAALCDAVTGEGNADEMLDFLTTRSLFLSQIDTRGERFRYHHLFADLLRHRLSASAP